MDVKVVEEEGHFRVYVDNRPIQERMSKADAEKLAAFLRRQIENTNDKKKAPPE